MGLPDHRLHVDVRWPVLLGGGAWQLLFGAADLWRRRLPARELHVGEPDAWRRMSGTRRVQRRAVLGRLFVDELFVMRGHTR